MLNSTKDLLDEIRRDERAVLEFEEVRFSGWRVSVPDTELVADELAAFANSRGGVFVFGVEDRTRDVVGIPAERLDVVVDFIKELCATSIDPPIEDLALDRLWLPSGAGEDVAVIKVEIPRSLFVHRSPGGFLHRVADSKRSMSTEYLAWMFQQRSQTRLIRFDEQIVEGAGIKDLTPDLWERFRTPRSDDGRDTFLRKLGFVGSAEEGTLRPTVAGVLMGSEDPRRWLPNAYVQAVAYRGDEIRAGSSEAPYQLDAADLSGPLDRQIVEACRFVVKNMTTAAFKTMGRVDHPQYDMAAVFEAVANAVAQGITPFTGPRFDCGYSRIAWRSTLRAPSQTRWPSTVSAIGNRLVTKRCAACSPSAPPRTNPGSLPIARTSWTSAAKAFP